MSKAENVTDSTTLPEPEAELVCEISCMCGFSAVVEEGTNGQSHGGTAADIGARHTCEYERGEIQLQKGTQTMRFNWVFR